MKRISQRQLKELQQDKAVIDSMLEELETLASIYATAKDEYNLAHQSYIDKKARVYG